MDIVFPELYPMLANKLLSIICTRQLYLPPLKPLMPMFFTSNPVTSTRVPC